MPITFSPCTRIDGSLGASQQWLGLHDTSLESLLSCENWPTIAVGYMAEHRSRIASTANGRFRREGAVGHLAGEVGSQTERLRDWHIVDQPCPADVHGGKYPRWGADGARDRRQGFGVADFQIFDSEAGLL